MIYYFIISLKNIIITTDTFIIKLNKIIKWEIHQSLLHINVLININLDGVTHKNIATNPSVGIGLNPNLNI